MKACDYRLLYLIYNVENESCNINRVAFLQALKKKPYCVQYRAKNNSYQFDYHQARKLKRLCTRYQTPFVINDSMQLARRVQADGLHIGQEDGKLVHLKKQLNWRNIHFNFPNNMGKKKRRPIIGVSCYRRLNLAVEAKKKGADYVAFGALFNSPTKPDKERVPMNTVRKAQSLGSSIVVIGGISPANFEQAKRSKAHAYAMISGINQLV